MCKHHTHNHISTHICIQIPTFKCKLHGLGLHCHRNVPVDRIECLPLNKGQIACITYRGLPRWLNGKEFVCQCKRYGFYPWVWKIPWRRKWPPTPVFLPGKSHGQRDLEGTVHGVTKESDMTEQLNNNNFIIFKGFAPKKSEK